METAGEPGTLLGVLQELRLADTVVDLRAGDSIVFFTDGVLDERTPSGLHQGHRLDEVLSEARSLTADEMAEVIDRHIAPARGERPPDDAAFLILRILS